MTESQLIVPPGSGVIPVLAARHLDPGFGRIETTMPEGMTLAEIVAAALPGASPSDLARFRVALVNAHGAMIVLPERWHQVRPKPGVRVVIRVIPGKNALKAVLSIVISIAAVAIGGWLAGAGWLGLVPRTAGYAIASAGIALGANLIGNMLLNALIPPVKPDNERREYLFHLRLAQSAGAGRGGSDRAWHHPLCPAFRGHVLHRNRRGLAICAGALRLRRRTTGAIGFPDWRYQPVGIQQH